MSLYREMNIDEETRRCRDIGLEEKNKGISGVLVIQREREKSFREIDANGTS